MYLIPSYFYFLCKPENVAQAVAHKMALLRQQLETEKEKGALKDKTIHSLKEKKAYLQSKLVGRIYMRTHFHQEGNPWSKWILRWVVKFYTSYDVIVIISISWPS